MDLGELAEQLADGRQVGRYLVQTVINRGQSRQHVVIGTARRLADGLCAHGRQGNSSRERHGRRCVVLSGSLSSMSRTTPLFFSLDAPQNWALMARRDARMPF